MARSNPTIAITGASGFLGGELVQRFAAMGWQVRALVRSPEHFTSNQTITYQPYDITKPLKPGVLADCDYLVHAAYVKQTDPNVDAFKLNVDGAERLLGAAKAAGVRRVLFISSQSAHDEATSVYGRQKLAIESLFQAAGGVSIRSGLIVGNGGLVLKMANFMRSKHMVPLIGGGRQPLQIIAVSDLVRVIEKLCTNKLTGTLTIATPKIYSYKDFYAALGKGLGIRFVFVPIPYIALQTAIRIITLFHIPLSVNEDNLIGLKNLRASKTKADLALVGIQLMSLEAALTELRDQT